MTSKQDLRRRFRSLRNQRDDTALGSAIQALLLQTDPKRHLGLYWALPGETDLRPLLPSLTHHRLALPCSDGRHHDGHGEGRLTYHPWDQGPLQLDGCGIPAPLGQPALAADELQLLLVPALAIDDHGIRLGYGGGYYDRLRADRAWGQVPALAVVPQACISSTLLPRDSWDQPFDGWVSEQGVHWCSESRL